MWVRVCILCLCLCVCVCARARTYFLHVCACMHVFCGCLVLSSPPKYTHMQIIYVYVCLRMSIGI